MLRDILYSSENTFLHHVSCIIAVCDIAYVKFFILPCAIRCRDIILCNNTATACINEIVTTHKISNNSSVDTLIVADIQTCSKINSLI